MPAVRPSTRLAAVASADTSASKTIVKEAVEKLNAKVGGKKAPVEAVQTDATHSETVAPKKTVPKKAVPKKVVEKPVDHADDASDVPVEAGKAEKKEKAAPKTKAKAKTVTRSQLRAKPGETDEERDVRRKELKRLNRKERLALVNGDIDKTANGLDADDLVKVKADNARGFKIRSKHKYLDSANKFAVWLYALEKARSELQVDGKFIKPDESTPEGTKLKARAKALQAEITADKSEVERIRAVFRKNLESKIIA